MVRDLAVPQPGFGDRGHAAARALLGSIPIVGSAASELFNAIVVPPLERRRDNFRQAVAEKLEELAGRKVLTVEGLQQNEGFISSVTQAAQAAMKTSSMEKREALRNAVLNSALPGSPDDSLRHIFIQFVDDLTEWHLRMLKLFHDPADWFQKNNRTKPGLIVGSLKNVLIAAYPELESRRAFYDLVASELDAKKLLDVGSLHATSSGNGMWVKRTTELGDKFLAFISEPK